ncbi:MAG TPA: ATP synthase F1 subunit delta [Armatimonadota bacterium]|jgi:F-type H+-transporting ATPase subunit delta
MDIAVLRNYAAALYEEAASADQLETIISALDTIEVGLRGAPEVLRLAAHPGVSTEDKLRLLLAPLEGTPPPLLERFLRLLLERHRFSAFADLVELVHQVQHERQGQQPIRVETAVALSAAQLDRLTAALESHLGRQVHLEQQVTPELLGGLRIHVSSEVLDESIAGRLDRLADYLGQPAPAASQV